MTMHTSSRPDYPAAYSTAGVSYSQQDLVVSVRRCVKTAKNGRINKLNEWIVNET
jgi:hypothetical protein